MRWFVIGLILVLVLAGCTATEVDDTETGEPVEPIVTETAVAEDLPDAEPIVTETAVAEDLPDIEPIEIPEAVPAEDSDLTGHENAAFGTGGAPSDPVIRAPVGSLVYEVVIQGTASRNSFNRFGYIIVSPTVTMETTNDVNPLEVWIVSGNPVITPEVGAINFSTNLFMRGSRSMLDVAWVSFDQQSGAISLRPDQNYAAHGLNVFNNSGGLLGGLYQVYDGQMDLRLSDDRTSIVGQVNFVGKGAYYYFDVSYVASIEGRLVQVT